MSIFVTPSHAFVAFTAAVLKSAAFVGALLVFWYYHHVAMKYFGGTTGDISGFFLCICEAGMAVILAVISNF